MTAPGYACSLFGGDFVECDKDAWVVTTAIVHEGSVDGLDSGGSECIKCLGCGLGCWSLGLLGSVSWFNPSMRGMLFSEWCRMVEFFECPADVARHGDIDVAFVVVPVKGEAAV
jgi:hypothetical protein